MRTMKQATVCSRGDNLWLAKISEAQDLLGKESQCAEAARRSSVEAMEWAFRLGKLLHELPKGYGKGVIANFSKDSGIPEGTLRDRIYLFRGCVDEDHIQRWPHMSRDYYIALGSSINGFFPDKQDAGRHWLVDLYVHWLLLDHPLLKEKNGGNVSDDGKVVEARRLLDAFHVKVRATPSLSWALARSTLTKVEPQGTYGFTVPNVTDEKEKKCCGLLLAEILRLCNNIQAMVGGGAELTNPDGFARDAGVLPPALFRPRKGDPLPRPGDALAWDRRKDFLRSAADSVAPATEKTVEQKLFLGRSERVLADTALFGTRTVDVVVTDPPYSKEYYKYVAWRSNTEVVHDSEETVVGQAALVGRIARVLVRQAIIKKQFIWFSFFPMDYAHVFVPPILEAFEEENGKDKNNVVHQILTWNKVTGTKVNNQRHMRRDVEGILYVNVGKRKLSETAGGQDCRLHSTLLTCPVRDRGMEDSEDRSFWKPIPLLQRLIGLATHEDHSPEADAQVVLDPFAGSGSTAIAAIRCGRDYRLIESHKGQFAVAEANLRKELAGGRRPKAETPRPSKTDGEPCPWRSRCIGMDDG